MIRILHAVRQMEETLHKVDAMVGAVPAAWLTWRPAPEVWSILDNLCHIEEFIPYWTDQIVAVASDPSHEWGRTHSDPARLAAVANTDKRDAGSVLASIHERFHAMKEQLLALNDKMLDTPAPSRNPRWGAMPASFILEQLLVHHLESHCSQIQRNIDRRYGIEFQIQI